MQTFSYDIVIVGGGMVGATLACALASQTSLSIAVLESQAQAVAWDLTHYHHRVSAISLSSKRIFKALNLWDNIVKKRVSPFVQIDVWDAKGGGAIHFDSREIAEPCLGYIIENNVIQLALEEKMKAYPQIDFIPSVKLTGFCENENVIKLISSDERIFKAKLAIAADGANSWLRTQVGIPIDKEDYAQEAIVTTVVTALPHERAARQVFLETGPLAFLPLSDDNTQSIVWSLPTDEAKRLVEIDDEGFKQALAQAFSYKLGNVLEVDKRYRFPLQRQQAKYYIKPRVALVGDAAHMVHPLAGQGVNLGLLDAASLLDVIVSAIKHRRDFSSLHHLRRYERWRRGDNLAMLNGVDFIKKIFASDKKSIQGARSFGLNMTNQIGWIKNIFIRHAVGDREALPEVAK